MDKLGDMELFVRVVRSGSLSATGRDVGLSPARMSARITGLEKHYGVKLLVRSTRRISLTEEGQEFLQRCQRILAEVEDAENQLQGRRQRISGPLRITATCDLGRQHVEPVLSRFVTEHPDVTPHLMLSDRIVNFSELRLDLAIRYGVLPDSTLFARHLASSRRVLCASPDYLDKHGTPTSPKELLQHACLSIRPSDGTEQSWHFHSATEHFSLSVPDGRSSNDGALIRQWALQGYGIALKSVWDIADDLRAGRLVTLLGNYRHDFSRDGALGGADLNAVYPNRDYLPVRTQRFIAALQAHFAAHADSLPAI